MKHKVIIKYNEKTPSSFLCDLLSSVFGYTKKEALDFASQLYYSRKSYIGVYSYSKASLKIYQAKREAKIKNIPIEIYTKQIRL